MNKHRYKLAGINIKKTSWTDLELEEICVALDSVIAFLEGRDDADIVLAKLRMENTIFNDMRTERKRQQARKDLYGETK